MPAEDRDTDLARYPRQEDFETQSRFELGVKISYLEVGVLIEEVLDGSPAQGIIFPGDIILEVDGFPIGYENQRTYVLWARYQHAVNGIVELTVVFRRHREYRYFYPRIELTRLTEEYRGAQGFQ